MGSQGRWKASKKTASDGTTNRHTDTQTDVATLWLNQPSGADSVKIIWSKKNWDSSFPLSITSKGRSQVISVWWGREVQANPYSWNVSIGLLSLINQAWLYIYNRGLLFYTLCLNHLTLPIVSIWLYMDSDEQHDHKDWLVTWKPYSSCYPNLTMTLTQNVLILFPCFVPYLIKFLCMFFSI